MVTTRTAREAVVADIRAHIDSLRRELDRFDKSGIRTGERTHPGPWIDTTDWSRQRIVDNIAEHERIAEGLQQEWRDA
jgi:hypothetical protein